MWLIFITSIFSLFFRFSTGYNNSNILYLNKNLLSLLIRISKNKRSENHLASLWVGCNEPSDSKGCFLKKNGAENLIVSDNGYIGLLVKF